MKKHVSLLLVIITFLGYTLVNKLMNIDAFIINIAKAGMFRGCLVNFAVFYALSSEILCIIFLIFKERIGICISLLVILSYTIYIVILKTCGKYEVCGCGGILNGLPFHWHFFINISLISVLLYLFYYEKKFK